MNLNNKKILITGATGGIGNALVDKFNNLGAVIFATGTNGEITPVTEMEGREIRCDQDFLEKIKNLFEAKLPSLCEPL